MFKLRVIAFIFSIVLVSCKTAYIDQVHQNITNQQVMLSSVGIEKNNIVQAGYTHTAVPSYKQPIKVVASMVSFNHKTFKAYKEAATKQGKAVAINYADSLKTKPNFINLEIADRVAVIQELNAKHNNEVKNYLATKSDALVVTNISVVFNNKLQQDLIKADKLFLEQDGLKSYALNMYSNNKLTNTIKLTDAVIFAYKTSSCCWQETDKQQLMIVDLVNKLNSCPRKTYKSAKRAKKSINYFKL